MSLSKRNTIKGRRAKLVRKQKQRDGVRERRDKKKILVNGRRKA